MFSDHNSPSPGTWIVFGLSVIALLIGMSGAAASPETSNSSNRHPGLSVATDALLEVVAKPGRDGSAAQAGDADRGGFEAIPVDFPRRFTATLTASEALQAMDDGLLTSAEYVDLLIERIEAFPEINAFITLDIEGARAAAEQADAMRAEGESMGALHGLPVVIKDSVDVAGLTTTAGTPALANFEPEDNAPVVQALVDAGAIILGKTNMSELSIGFTNNNGFAGPTRNPYDLERIPGGSSGGNAAALAARLAPLAIGEDTSGSIRVPAALTGTFGFRPTTGRYSSEGVVPLSPTLDTLGPMARDVRDLALADAVITGQPNELEPVAVSGLRIGVPRALFRDVLDFSVEWHFYRVLRRLERAGATLVPADIPGVGDQTIQAFQVIVFFEPFIALPRFLAENEIDVTTEELLDMVASPGVAGIIDAAVQAGITEQQYNQVIDGALPQMRAAYRQYLADNQLDAVIYPSAILPAALIGQEQFVEVNGFQVSTFEAYLRNAHYIPMVNAPTVTVPIGQTREQLPAAAIDIAGAPGEDRRTLAVAHAIAQIVPRIRAPREIRPLPFMH